LEKRNIQTLDTLEAMARRYNTLRLHSQNAIAALLDCSHLLSDNMGSISSKQWVRPFLIITIVLECPQAAAASLHGLLTKTIFIFEDATKLVPHSLYLGIIGIKKFTNGH